MRKQKTRRSNSARSILLRWALTYVLVLLIPLACSIYGTQKNIAVIRRQVSSSNQSLLSTISGDLDRTLNRMNDAYTYVLRNEYYIKTNGSSSLDNSFRLSYAVRLMNALSNYCNSVDPDMRVIICYTKKEYMITNGSANELMSYYRVAKMNGFRGSSYDWKKQLTADYGTAHFSVSSAFNPYSDEDQIVLSATIHGITEPINLFIMIPAKKFTQSITLNDRYLLIADANHETLLLSELADGSVPAITEFPYGIASGDLLTGSDNIRYICDFTQSDTSRWFYAIITSEATYWSQLRATQTLVTVSTLIAVVLGLGVSVIFLMRNYRPVAQIMEIVDHSLPHRNEFDLIEQSMHKLITQTSQQSAQLRKQFLLAKLKNRTIPVNDRELYKEFEIAKPGESIALVAFALNDYADIPADYKDELEYENMNLYAVDNVFRELAEGFAFDQLEDGHTQLYLLHLDSAHQAEWEKKGFSILEQICTLFEQSMQAPIYAALSESTKDPDLLSALYCDVNDVLEYQRGIRSSGSMRTRDFKAQTDPALPRTDYTQALAAAVEIGDMEAAESIVAQLFGEYHRSSAISFSIVRIRVAELLYSMLNSYYKVVNDLDLRQRLVLNMEQVISATDEESLHSGLLALLKYACSTIHTAAADPHDGLVNRICDYIRANYADCNLNISSVAEEFRRNPQSLSRIFSTQMQKGMLDFINDVRCEHARTLLADGRFTVEDVAIQVGFSNIRTFRRAFSRLVGAPPSAFRPNKAEEDCADGETDE